MTESKVTEYVMVKNKVGHPKLEKCNGFEWKGDLIYINEVFKMLKKVYKMNKLSTERAYVIAFDHSKKPLGMCLIGQGDSTETPLSLKNVFSFLLLTGATSFTVVRNRVSDFLRATVEDEQCVLRLSMFADDFDMEFIGLMIICSDEYIVVSDGDYGKSSYDNNYECIGDGLAVTYILGERIEGPIEDIKKLVNKLK